MSENDTHYSTEQMIADSERIALRRAAEAKGEQPYAERVTEIAEAANTGSTWTENHAALSGKILRRVADIFKEYGGIIKFVNNEEVTAITESGAHMVEIHAGKANYNARVLDGDKIIYEGLIDSRKDVENILIKFR